jgi:hypothetical protein
MKKVFAIVLAVALMLSLMPLAVSANSGTIYVDDDNCPGPGSGTSSDPYCSIQVAVDAASSGDTIIVAEGSYDEDLTIDESVTIEAGSNPVVYGDHTITASDVTLDSLTLEPDNIAVTIDSSSNDIDNTTITNCTVNLDSGEVGIWIGGGSPAYAVTDVEMSGNTFNGPTDMIANPWKIGGWFTYPIACEVSGVEFVNNMVDSASIPINLDDKDIEDVLISGNTFTNTDGVVYVWGEDTPTGVLSGFVFSCNDVDYTNSYGVGIDVGGAAFDDANFGAGNEVKCNNFVGIPGEYGFGAVSILSSLSSYTLDATNNWWGSVEGPQVGDVSANVVYDPWSLTPDPCEPKTIGFWKNHPDSLDAVLALGAISLGDYSVDSNGAQGVLEVAKAKCGEDMLAAQLLTAELNVLHLTDLDLYTGCADDDIDDADAALIAISYAGPDDSTCIRKGSEKGDLMAIADSLDEFNNGGCGGYTCDWD